MTKPLPYDMSRCYGDNCDKKERCKRFLTMAIDEYRLLSYVLTMVKNGVCNDMIKDK
jgi:hypothetical protein